METYPKVTLDLTTNPTITWTATHNLGNISLLSVRNKNSSDFMSLGLNYSILDGSLSQTLTNIAYASNIVSGSNGEFSQCTITGTFAEPQDFLTTTLKFGTNYPKKIKIEYLNQSYSLITSEEIDNIDRESIFTNRSVTSCYQIKLTFLESWNPYQICCLQEWIIGALLEYTQENLVSLKINESCDPITRELPISTAQMEAYPLLAGFDISDPNGVTKYIKPGRIAHISTTIVINGVSTNIDYGTWYVKKLESDDNITIKLSFENMIGRLNDFNFSNSLFYSKIPTSEIENRSVRAVVTSIVNSASLSCEFIHSAGTNIVHGFFPYISCREALKQVCFACGLLVRANNIISIVEPEQEEEVEEYKIEEADITEPPRYDLQHEFRSCTLTYEPTYNLDQNESDLVTGITSYGVYSHEPAINVQLRRTSDSGTAALLENNLTNARLAIFEEGEFKLIGRKYSPDGGQKTLTVEDRNVGIIGTGKINIPASGNITVGNSDLVAEQTLQFMNDNLLKTNLEYISKGQRVGYKTQIVLNDKTITGWITHQSIDLVNGMITQLELLGGTN